MSYDFNFLFLTLRIYTIKGENNNNNLFLFQHIFVAIHRFNVVFPMITTRTSVDSKLLSISLIF